MSLSSPLPPAPTPPLINLPPVTLALIVVIVAIQGALVLGPADFHDRVLAQFAFTPALSHFDLGTAITLISYQFLHGSWAHVGMNAAFIAAFGAGVERRLGSGRMATLFLLSGVGAAGAHFGVSSDSFSPLIGASGGGSGLFAGVICFLTHKTPSKLIPMTLVWLFLNALTGLFIDAGEGSSIAWQAHMGGFFMGMALFLMMDLEKYKKKAG